MTHTTTTLGNGKVITKLIPSKLKTIPSWWDTNAVSVVDGVGGLGTTVPNGYANLEEGGPWENSFSGSTSLPEYSNEQVNTGRLTSLKMNSSWIKFNSNTIAPRDMGDLTIECVVYIPSAGFIEFCPYAEFSSTSDRFQIALQPTRLYCWSNSSNPQHDIPISTPQNQWSHFALTYASGTSQWKLYINGTLSATWNRSIQAATITKPLMGSYTTTYVDKWQIIPSIKYTSNFTPAI